MTCYHNVCKISKIAHPSSLFPFAIDLGTSISFFQYRPSLLANDDSGTCGMANAIVGNAKRASSRVC